MKTLLEFGNLLKEKILEKQHSIKNSTNINILCFLQNSNNIQSRIQRMSTILVDRMAQQSSGKMALILRRSKSPKSRHGRNRTEEPQYTTSINRQAMLVASVYKLDT
jgi:hypothetical protein